MGRWRGRRLFAAPRATAALLACVLGAVALIGAGCGAEEHVNDSRPQPPTRVSVAISEDAITVQPPRIAVGPEPTQQIPQNVHVEQPQVRSQAAARRRPRRRQPDRRRLPPRDTRRRQRLQLRAALRQLQRHPADDPPHRRLYGHRRRHPRGETDQARRRPVPVVVRERRAPSVETGPIRRLVRPSPSAR